MSVYVDPPGSAPGQLGRVRFVSHLFADNVAELVRFGGAIGLRREWLQGPRPAYPLERRLPHFDVTAGKRAQAVASGAIELSRQDAVEIWQRLKVTNEEFRASFCAQKGGDPCP